jgi:hypothetical protein
LGCLGRHAAKQEIKDLAQVEVIMIGKASRVHKAAAFGAHSPCANPVSVLKIMVYEGKILARPGRLRFSQRFC